MLEWLVLCLNVIYMSKPVGSKCPTCKSAIFSEESILYYEIIEPRGDLF